MVYYAYFSAPDDQTAALALVEGPDPARSDVLDVKGLEPVIHVGKLEALLRGVDYDAVKQLPRFADLVSDPDAEAAWVVTITDTLQGALAGATDPQLSAVSGSWSQIEEFSGSDTSGLVDFLRRLAHLARQACERGHRLYCHVSL